MPNVNKYDHPAEYKIKVKGILDPSWSDWFDHLKITSRDDLTILEGPVTDQAGLLGILTKINDLGLVILEVSLVDYEMTSPGNQADKNLEGGHYGKPTDR